MSLPTTIHIIAEMPEGGIRIHGFFPRETAAPGNIPPDPWGNCEGTLEEVTEAHCRWWTANGFAFEEITE